MNIRYAAAKDIPAIAMVEAECFPPAEAATGVNTLPDYRKRGYAGKLICRAIEDAKQQGRKGLVLTCKENLILYYAKFGFKDEGVTNKSTHGNVVWHQMRLSFHFGYSQ